jgi:CspA family cold shock protein
MRGRVKCFKDEKGRGWGFIRQPDGSDIFVHFSNITGTGYKYLVEGEEVDYTVGPGPRGPQALNVTRFQRGHPAKRGLSDVEQRWLQTAAEPEQTQ